MNWAFCNSQNCWLPLHKHSTELVFYDVWSIQVVATILTLKWNLFPLQGGNFIEPPSVFRVYMEKLFWEGEQKAKESEADQPVSWFCLQH